MTLLHYVMHHVSFIQFQEKKLFIFKPTATKACTELIKCLCKMSCIKYKNVRKILYFVQGCALAYESVLDHLYRNFYKKVFDTKTRKQILNIEIKLLVLYIYLGNYLNFLFQNWLFKMLCENK